jgi:hypothetical protein
MAMFCFLPWLRLKEPVSFDGHTLVPFTRGERSPQVPTEVQLTAESILGHYFELKNRPVDRAVFMVHGGHKPLDDLDADERQQLFTAVEVLSFAGLSAREFFAHGYWNRDHFQLVIQSFAGDPDSGVMVSSRRRDGGTNSYRTSDVLEFYRPNHVPLFGDVSLDSDLLSAVEMEAARDSKRWGDIAEAMLGFNLANTDSEAIAERVEAVVLAGAFERLLNCSRGKEYDVAVSFARTVVPTYEAEFRTWLAARDPSAPELTNGRETSLREMWMRDFYRLRNDFAHGRNAPRRRPQWPLWDHLLLASYIFPRALKSELARSGGYSLSNRDQAEIDAFEALAMSLPIGKLDVGSEHPWHAVLGQARVAARLAEGLARLRPPGQDAER